MDPLIRRMGFTVEIAKRRKDHDARFGKTAMQKLVYLLQEVAGLDLGYRFGFYNYGPYSAEIMGDIDYGDAIGLLQLEYDEDRGYAIQPGSKASELSEYCNEELLRAKDRLDDLFERFGQMNARDLELRATIVYVNRDEPTLSVRQLSNRVEKLKPKYDPSVVGEAITELADNGSLLRAEPG